MQPLDMSLAHAAPVHDACTPHSMHAPLRDHSQRCVACQVVLGVASLLREWLLRCHEQTHQR